MLSCSLCNNCCEIIIISINMGPGVIFLHGDTKMHKRDSTTRYLLVLDLALFRL